MSKIKVLLIGSEGHMGQQILASLSEQLDFVALVDPNTGGNSTLDETLASCVKPDVALDFSLEKAVLGNAGTLNAAGIPVIIGATGISADDFEALKKLGEKGVMVAVVPNFSIGVYELNKAAVSVANAFPEAAATVYEVHHAGKKDAPSGTALALAKAIYSARHKDIPVEEQQGDRCVFVGKEIYVFGERNPYANAELKVVFAVGGERIELKHEAKDRTVYMPGIVKAAEFAWLHSKGFYHGLSSILEA